MSVKHSATTTGVLKGSHGQFSYQGPEHREVMRAQGSFQNKQRYIRKTYLFYGNQAQELQKAQEVKADGAKAQKFSKSGFLLMLYSLMYCYSQDLLQCNDLITITSSKQPLSC